MNRSLCILTGAAAYLAGTYYYQVVARPKAIAAEAITFAAVVNKPVLNVGAGTQGSSFRVKVFGPTGWGDVNCDVSAPRENICTKDKVCFCDIYKLPWSDKFFGSVIVSHVLTFLDRPQDALAECKRVADRVYVVTHKWWCPGSWFTYVGENRIVKNNGNKVLEQAAGPEVTVW